MHLIFEVHKLFNYLFLIHSARISAHHSALCKACILVVTAHGMVNQRNAYSVEQFVNFVGHSYIVVRRMHAVARVIMRNRDGVCSVFYNAFQNLVSFSVPLLIGATF